METPLPPMIFRRKSQKSIDGEYSMEISDINARLDDDNYMPLQNNPHKLIR